MSILATAALTMRAMADQLSYRSGLASRRLVVRASASCRPLLGGSEGGLRNVLYSGLSRRFPLEFAAVPDGLVLMANGIDPMLRWDGTSLTAEVAGVPAPATAPTLAFSSGPFVVPIPGTGEVTAYVRFYDRHGNVSDLSPVSDPVVMPTNFAFTVYTNLPVPTGIYASKVVGRQVLRSTAGQATTYYVDIDTTDLVSTALGSFNSDVLLLGQEAVPLFDETGSPLANIHGFPPSWKKSIVSHLGRCFAAADAVYDEGHIRVVAGSSQVVGVGTQWPASFTGRSLFVVGSFARYEIAAVDVAAQVLTLEVPYGGPDALFAHYAIRPPPAEWRRIYYTPAGQPESWPATYALDLVEDGDEITGLMTQASFVYFLEQRHIYKFTFKDDPATDGATFQAVQRGCINPRCWVQAEDTCYMLDEQGIHAFNGSDSQPISAPIQDLFRDDTSSPLRVDWDADTRYWHAIYSEVHATVRFFVALTGDRYPRHAICYNYRDDRWWIEEYKRPICSSTPANVGIARVLCGIDHREVIALNVGWDDGLRDVGATTTGAVTAATAVSLTDDSAQFSADTVNLAVFLVTGLGKGQWRRVVLRTATRLDLLTPWLVSPRVGDRYVVAGVDFEWRSGWFRFSDENEMGNARDVELSFQPVASGVMDLELSYNHVEGSRAWSRSADGSVTVVAGEADAAVDLAQPQGRAIQRLEGHLETYAAGDRYVSPRLAGVQSVKPIRIFRCTLNGVEQSG